MAIARGSERVKAWIYAIINPWSEALEVENQLLATGNTTYRWTTQRLEFIRPVAEHLAGRGARLVLDDFLRGQPGAAELVQQHDPFVKKLSDSAIADHDRLASDLEFVKVIQRLRDTAPVTSPADMGTNELARWAAQRIINNGADVSQRWDDYGFWKQHEATLLSYRARAAGVLAATEELSSANASVMRQLVEIRNQLVDSYDVPPAYVA